MRWDWLRLRPISKPKFQGYAGSTTPKFGLKPSIELGLRLHLNLREQRTCITPTIRESAPANSEVDTAPEAAEAGQDNVTNAPTPLDKPAEETEHPRVLEKDKTINQETPQDVMKPPANPQAPIVEKEAPEKIELVLASLAVPIQAVPPPSQGSKASNTASQQPSKDKLTIKLKK